MHSTQVHGTFATTGSDGGFNFWDKDSKQRLKVVFPLIFLKIHLNIYIDLSTFIVMLLTYNFFNVNSFYEIE
jgi:hypothetical protein